MTFPIWLFDNIRIKHRTQLNSSYYFFVHLPFYYINLHYIYVFDIHLQWIYFYVNYTYSHPIHFFIKILKSMYYKHGWNIWIIWHIISNWFYGFIPWYDMWPESCFARIRIKCYIDFFRWWRKNANWHLQQLLHWKTWKTFTIVETCNICYQYKLG